MNAEPKRDARQGRRTVVERQTPVLKTFPDNWTLPIKRSALVMADSPRPRSVVVSAGLYRFRDRSSVLLDKTHQELADLLAAKDGAWCRD